MFAGLSVIANLAIFAAAGAVVWFAGTRLARNADALASKTRIGHQFIGLALLGGITSLPELAVATTATLNGAPMLAVNNVLGSASVNVLILAAGDAFLGRRAITSVQGSAGVMLQGALGIALLAMVASATVTGDVTILGMGIWTWLMLGAFLVSLRILAGSQAEGAWRVTNRHAGHQRREKQQAKRALSAYIGGTVTCGVAIVAAGYVLAQSGQALAEQTGLGTSFFGAVVLALSTSLPEWSTVIESIRLNRYDMAIGDVFGTNMFNVTIVVLIDALFPGEPVLEVAGRFSGFAALFGLMLTALFLVGLIERRDRTVLRMGVDSLCVVLAYIAGVAVLNGLR